MSLEDKYDEVKELISLGKERGYLSYDEVNDMLPHDLSSTEDLDDLFDLFGSNGIELIGEDIMSEGQVVDLLDFDLKYGQGDLFAPPKPVRADVLWPRAEREPVAAAPRAEPAARAPTQAAAGSKPAEAKPAEAKAGDAPRRGGLADLAKTTIRRV